MRKSYVKAASTAKMLEAFQNQIRNLEDDGVNACSESIKGATSADMIDAFYQKIDELEGTAVESSTDAECCDGITDKELESVEGADSEYDVFMLMDYAADNGENGMEGDDFYPMGKFFAKNLDDAEAQLEVAFKNQADRLKNLSNPYVTEYNEYFDDGEEVYPDLATLIEKNILTPEESADIYDVDENGMPVFSAQQDNMYDAAYSFEMDERKMDKVYDELWDLKDDNPEISKAIEKFDADHHGEYEPARFVLEVGYGLDPDDYIGVPPFTIYITNRSIGLDSSNDMLNDLAVPGSIEVFDTSVEGCDAINAADDIDDDFGEDSDYDVRFDSEADEWELVDKKSIRDFDGFLTEYSLYHNTVDDIYVCVFGDSDLYRPEDGEWDAEFDTYDEAIEWFNNYSVDDE